VTRIHCLQLAPRVGDPEGTRRRCEAAVGQAAAAGAELIVLPELATSGYVFDSPSEARDAAVRRDDPVFDGWARAADGAVVVGGFAELGDDDRVYNSAAVVDSAGLVAVYRKLHLWDREELFFTPGSDPAPVLDVGGLRLGVLICYDLEFPELTRGLALRGADLLVVPTNWPEVPRPPGERAPEVVIAMATARVNRVAVACTDRCGTERGQRWTAGTTIVGADGWVVADAGTAGAEEPTAVVAELDPRLSRDKALTPRADVRGDRRPELYTELSDPRPGS
jgi:5-aminopentanamidase